MDERGSDDMNSNTFLAARQRLRQQQQELQNDRYEQNRFTNKFYDNNGVATCTSNNNNNFEYNNNLQQQRHQQLQNRLINAAEPHMINSAKEADTKQKSATMDMRRVGEVEADTTAAKMKSELSEIFRGFQNAQQNQNAKLFHQTKLLRRSAPTIPNVDSALSTDEEELDLDLPYGIQNVRKRMARHKPDLTKSITYQSLCPTKRIAIPLETSGYEYRPSHYIEVTCAHYTPAHSYEFRKNRICSEAGFSCIQLNRTIHLIRRNKSSNDECWESEIRIVPSGCECMWPKHDNGDIAAYHEGQKRFGGYANVHANADYEQGEGYRQIQPQQIELFGINGLRRGENSDGVGFEAFEYN
ncbi:uncharacterized protein LOC129244134 [Anastrepha obliqua]|uniref:uncharacterized protein LOC129244134 n=1 Tax=Anastrepha obliqua TaxID=95512 RepID=UPI002409C469|nr:uncharacterized protein LOC129244134 [Anastrepha obliqua]